MILVTGAGGFLGPRLVRALAAAGAPAIRCLVRPGRTARLAGLTEEISGTRVEVAGVNLTDTLGLRAALAGVEVIYHAAAAKHGSPPAMVASTVVGSDALYRAAVDAGVARFVLVSSFGVMEVAPLRAGSLVDENTPLDRHPEWRDAYAFSKHRQETLAREFAARSGLPLVVVRPGVIFGPGEEILTTRIGVWLPGVFLHLGNGNRIPLTHVDNCAEAIARAGLAPHVEGETFCILDDDPPKSRQVLKRYRREVSRVRVVSVPHRALRVLARLNVWYSARTNGHWPVVFSPYEVASIWKPHRFSNRRAKERLGWSPRIPMARALDDTFAALAESRPPASAR